MQSIKTIKKSLVLLASAMLMISCTSEDKVVVIKEKEFKAKLIYQENFEENLEDWQVEQMEGGTAKIQEGKLEINDVSGCTIWLKEKFDGSIMIEYDVFLIQNGGENDRVSDLNCFWMAQDMEHPADLFANSERRGGKFSNYDSLRLYYMGVGGHFNTKTRFRRYVGNGERPLLPEHDLTAPEYMLQANKGHHIKIIANNGEIQYYRDNQLLVDFVDSDPYTSGYFGFRTVKNHMTVDNFKVYQLSKK